MSRVVKFPVTPPAKLGPRKVRKRKQIDLEAHGQLNLFDQVSEEAKVIVMPVSDSFFEEALRLDEMGDTEAEKYYLLAISNNERVEDASCNLGIMKSEQGEKAKAIDYLTRTLKDNPRHFEAHYNLANVYSDLGNYDLAKTHYEVAINIDGTFPNTYYNLGLVLISQKKYQEAIVTIDKYITLSPNHDNSIASELIKTLKALA